MVAYTEFAGNGPHPSSATYDAIEDKVSAMFKVEKQTTINKRKRKKDNESFGSISAKRRTVEAEYKHRGKICREKAKKARAKANDHVDIAKMTETQTGHRGLHQDTAYLDAEVALWDDEEHGK